MCVVVLVVVGVVVDMNMDDVREVVNDQNLFNLPIHKFKFIWCYSTPVMPLQLELGNVFIRTIFMVILMKMLISVLWLFLRVLDSVLKLSRNTMLH